MSTSTLSGRQGVILTDPKFIPATRGLTKWVNKMANRRDLTVRIIAKTDGAPARFIQARASIDISERLLEGIDPGLIGSQEFVALYPSKAGIVVHESIGHAMNSYLLNMDPIFKIHGPKHVAVFKYLEEGRCERQGLPHATKVEKYALQSAVLDIILEDLAEEDAEAKIASTPAQLVLQTMALVAARADAGILNMDMPKAQKVMSGLQLALDSFYVPFLNVAVEFSNCQVGPWNSDEKHMNELVQKWIKLQDEFLKEVEEPKNEDGTVCGFPVPPTGGTGTSEEKQDPGEGTGVEPGTEPLQAPEEVPDPRGDPFPGGDQGQQQDQDVEDTESGGQSGEGNEESEQGDKQPGIDDEGKPGDGSQVLTTDMVDENIDNADLGTYAGGTSLEDVYREIVKEIQEASDEARKVSGHRLGMELKAIHKSSALEHADRRKRNAVAAKLWK